jgi:hypothetical protein
MLRSLQTTDPIEAWKRSHSDLLKLDTAGRISNTDMSRILGMHCRGIKAQKDTLHWALGQRLVIPFVEAIPTEYALTDIGRKWPSE